MDRAQAAANREAELADLRSLMRTIEGRRFIWRLLSECGIFRTSFSPDAPTMAHNEGRRAIGLWLFADLREGMNELYLTMENEAAAAAAEERARRERERRIDNDD